MNYREFCLEEYKRLFQEYLLSANQKQKVEDKRKVAQKQAIREATINAIKSYPSIEPADIWKTIYIAHVYNVSGVNDSRLIDTIISADNSWKKSSGHAFEEMIKEIGNLSLNQYGLEIILQRDLNYLLKDNKIKNEVRDISWLKEQVKSSVFDLYLTIRTESDYIVFGCVQSKTSIRDRVTRDREPSINAMAAYFFSVAIVLDGTFLKLPKFTAMVNGGTPEYELNGWHGMYVLSNKSFDNDRIHSTDILMEKFVSDAIDASSYWKKNRQWFNASWRPSIV